MERLFFGTEGTPSDSKGKSSIAGLRRLSELGLGCMELQFLHDVRMGEETARNVQGMAKKFGIKLSAHAPYYINLNAGSEKLFRYRELVLQSARIASICGARSIVLHAGSRQRNTEQAVYGRIKKVLGGIMEQLKNEGVEIELRVETTGKSSQFGSLEEVLSLTEAEGILPCISFPHLHERTEKYNSGEGFAGVLAQIEERLGCEGLDDMYIHASGAEPQEKREKKYPALAELDFKYKEMAQVFSDFDIRGMVVSGSPHLENDALALKREYDRIKKQR